jgi:Fe-S cluster assembly protein SufD
MSDTSRDLVTEAAEERAALAGQVLGRDVGAAAGPPRQPATGTAVAPGAYTEGGPGRPPGREHGHGPGAPSGTPAERFTSADPDAFDRPTGREEDWRFTPLARMRSLFEPFAPDGKLVVETRAPAEVEVRQVDRGHPLVGSVLAPADRVSALALAQVEQALLVSVPRRATVSTPTVVTLRGEPGDTYGHVVVDVGDRPRSSAGTPGSGTSSSPSAATWCASRRPCASTARAATPS